MSKKFEEWDLIGEFGERIIAMISKYQELKLALVHREIQRMADDTEKDITWDKDQLSKLKEQWQKAFDDEQHSFVFEAGDKSYPILVTYGRYLIEYLEYIFGEEVA